jgi:hypothetical protein
MALTQGAFNPTPQSSTIAATSTTQRVALGARTTNVYVANVGSGEAFVNFGDATVVAVAGGAATAASDGHMSIPSGFFGVIATSNQTNMAAICASGVTTTLRITPGEGE